MKHFFVINPAAGKKTDPAALSARITEIASARGEPFEIYVTTGPMDACEAVRREADKGGEVRVYACGGDGTLNECVNGAAGRENVSVTHYPTGTGNDFIRVFGADDVERFRDLELLMDGEAVPLDLIDCNGRYAINICSVGIDARIGTQVHEYSSKPLLSGGAAYVASLVVNVFRGINQRLKITHESSEEGEYALVCVCNGSYYGGGFHPVPEAVPNDGTLDCLVVKGVGIFGFARMVGRYSKGRYAEMGKIMTLHRGAEFAVECDEPLDVNVDGELIRGSSVRFSLRPGAVSFVLPKGSDFLASCAQRAEH